MWTTETPSKTLKRNGCQNYGISWVLMVLQSFLWLAKRVSKTFPKREPYSSKNFRCYVLFQYFSLFNSICLFQTDLRHTVSDPSRLVSCEEGASVAKELGLPYTETSALTFSGLKKCFDQAVRRHALLYSTSIKHCDLAIFSDKWSIQWPKKKKIQRTR